ncbi:MAG TPA: OstA-like protein, partial [Pelobium sp.]|nr:OstA-like protein [Pelobium sp.]
MRKYLLFLLFVGYSLPSVAQQVTRVELLQSESFIGLKRNGENTNKVIKPVFQQDNATLTCDSAYFYLSKNSFEAFGNVHINQADTVNIYSDNLNYDGNTKTAVLTNNVRLTDNQAVLTTNNLIYNLGTRIGQYVNGGKIVNGNNTLTSQNGYYFTQNKDAYFRYNVEVKSPQVLIKSDTLKYNTISKIAYFFGPTNIYGKTDTLYTENGQYNTKNDQASFGKKNLYTQNSKSLKGDSLFYDGKQGYGRAVKNIIFTDTAQKIEL